MSLQKYEPSGIATAILGLLLFWSPAAFAQLEPPVGTWAATSTVAEGPDIPGTQQGFDLRDVDLLLEEVESLDTLPVLDIGGQPALPFAIVDDRVTAHHPLVMAARQRRRIADGKLLEAQGGFDLKLGVDGEGTPIGYYDFGRLDAKLVQPTPLWGATLFGGWNVGLGNVPPYDGQYNTLDGGEMQLGLRLPVWRGGPIDERRAKLRQAEAGIEVAAAELEVERLIIRIMGAEAYWKWVAAGQQYLVVQALLELARVRDTQLAEKVRRGAIPPIERAENLRALLSRRQDLVTARRKLEMSAIKLSLFFRDDEGRPIIVEANRLPRVLDDPVRLSPQQREEGIQRALAKRPEIERYNFLVDRQRVAVDLATNRVAPRAELEFKMERDFGTLADVEKRVTLEPTELKAGIMIDFPLQLRKERGARNQAEAKLREVLLKARWQRDKVLAQVQDLWSRLAAAGQRVRVAKRTVRVARAVAAGERTRFDLGATSLFIVNLREQAAADAEKKAIDALADYQVAAMAWHLATMAEP